MGEMTPRQKTVFDAIVRAARAGLPCPTNSALAYAMGNVSVSVPAEVVRALEKAGRIKVVRGQCSRIVTIPELGISTAQVAMQTHWRDRGPDYTKPPRPKVDRATILEQERLRVERLQARRAAEVEAMPEPILTDPCFACGVPHHKHDEHGCKRWRPRG